MEVLVVVGVLTALLVLFFLKFLPRKKIQIIPPGPYKGDRRVHAGLIIEPASSGQKIIIEENLRVGFSRIKVSLFLTNLMPCDILISKIFWTAWFSNFVHNGALTREIVVPPLAAHFEIKLSDPIDEQLSGDLGKVSSLASSAVQGFLEGKVIFRPAKGSLAQRIFSQVFSCCGFSLELKGTSSEKRKTHAALPKDLLTGLLTRQFLDVQLQSLIDAFVPSRLIALLILDIDDFKPINDKYGHLIGDEVLRLLSREIQNLLPLDSFAVRYGGDEFVIILQDKGFKETEKFAQALRTSVSMIALPLETGLFLNFTISIGLTIVSVRAPYQQWLKLADDVLRLAKRQGKNRLAVNRRAPDISS